MNELPPTQPKEITTEQLAALTAFEKYEEQVLNGPAHRMDGESLFMYHHRQKMAKKIKKIRREHGYSNPVRKHLGLR